MLRHWLKRLPVQVGWLGEYLGGHWVGSHSLMPAVRRYLDSCSLVLAPPALPHRSLSLTPAPWHTHAPEPGLMYAATNMLLPRRMPGCTFPVPAALVQWRQGRTSGVPLCWNASTSSHSGVPTPPCFQLQTGCAVSSSRRQGLLLLPGLLQALGQLQARNTVPATGMTGNCWVGWGQPSTGSHRTPWGRAADAWLLRFSLMLALLWRPFPAGGPPGCPEQPGPRPCQWAACCEANYDADSNAWDDMTRRRPAAAQLKAGAQGCSAWTSARPGGSTGSASPARLLLIATCQLLLLPAFLCSMCRPPLTCSLPTHGP